MIFQVFSPYCKKWRLFLKVKYIDLFHFTWEDIFSHFTEEIKEKMFLFFSCFDFLGTLFFLFFYLRFTIFTFNSFILNNFLKVFNSCQLPLWFFFFCCFTLYFLKFTFHFKLLSSKKKRFLVNKYCITAHDNVVGHRC